MKAGFSGDRKSTRLNSSHLGISYAVFCLKKNKTSRRGRVLTDLCWLRSTSPCPRGGLHRSGLSDPKLPPRSLGHSDSPPLSFFFNDTATTEIYTLSLHDALPISQRRSLQCVCKHSDFRGSTTIVADISPMVSAHRSEMEEIGRAHV